MENYDYHKECKKLIYLFETNFITFSESIKFLDEIEDKAIKTYPNSEPDGDIEYCISITFEELHELNKTKK